MMMALIIVVIVIWLAVFSLETYLEIKRKKMYPEVEKKIEELHSLIKEFRNELNIELEKKSKEVKQ